MSLHSQDFWQAITAALEDVPYMLPEDAASMMVCRLDEYRYLWPILEADIKTNLYYRGQSKTQIAD
jgi:hypothetical protein